MGEGNYTENDVKELAKALTGASVNRQTGLYQFRRRNHDTSSKTIFDNTANFHPDDVADLILQQPQVAPFIASKIYKFLVGTLPSDETLTKIAQQFAESDFDISVLVSEILNHVDFWQSEGAIIKSPVELLIGTIQLAQIPIDNTLLVVRYCRKLGQDLFDPPHVKGWAEGFAWYATNYVGLREKAMRLAARKATKIPAIEQLFAVTTVADLSAVDAKNFALIALNDPAFQVT